MKPGEFSVGVYLREIFIVMEPDVYRATKYVSEKFVVKVTRRGKPGSSNRILEYVITAGRPDFSEQEFIKKCKIVGEPFPVKKIQFKYYPQRQKKAA